MRIFTFLLLFSLTVTGCQNDADMGNSGSATVSNGKSPSQITIPDTKEARLLLRDYWVFEYYVAPNNPDISAAHRGNWYKFNADGTCLAGHWQDYEMPCTWELKQGPSYPLIRIWADDESLTGEYQIQGISGSTEYMSWVGTAFKGKKGYSAKVMNLLSEPTRKQFGIEN